MELSTGTDYDVYQYLRALGPRRRARHNNSRCSAKDAETPCSIDSNAAVVAGGDANMLRYHATWREVR